MRFYYFIYVAVLVMHNSFAQQKIGTNRTTLNPNAIFEMEATNKGMLLPRVDLTSTSSYLPMTEHVNGLTVYNLATANDVTPGFYYNDGTKWIRIGQSLPAGGTANQVLSKVDGSDYNTQWTTLNTSGDLRLVNTSSHITQDAGVGSNGSSAGNEHVIAIGNQAGNANSGRYNVFVGSSSGKSNTSGENNTFLGFRAGEANTSGSTNTFIGNWAGVANTTGNGNSFFGNYSGGLNTTGYSNTFLGIEAGKSNTTGYRNVAVGQLALEKNSEGNNNTAVGFYALSKITNGSSNVAIGVQSLLALTNASNNTAVGNSSLLYTTTGANNIAVGRSSGENITTGSNNIAIGVSSFVPSATADYQLSIGNLIYGVNLNGGGSTISTGNIGIGTTSPSEKLDVAGAVKFSGALMPNNTAGTSGQVLTSAGSGNAPTWTSLPSTLYNSNGSLPTNTTRAVTFNTGSNLNLDEDTFYLDGNNNRLGIGTSSPQEKMHIKGGNLLVVDSDNKGGLIKGFDDHHAIYMRESGNNLINYYEYGGTLASGAGHVFKTGGLKNDQTTKFHIADDAIYMANKVGIGTTSPSYPLHVVTSGADAVRFEGSSSATGVAGASTLILVNKNSTNNNYSSITARNSSSGYSSSIEFLNQGNGASGAIRFITNYSGSIDERFRITPEGYVGIGTSSPTALLSVNGSANNTTGAWGTFSDARIKTVKEEFKDGLNVIKAIKPVKFVYNEKAPFKSNEVQIGIIAQDLEQIAPYMVSKTTHGEITDLREVNTQAYVFLLINAVKEQQKEIEELKKEIELLKK